MTWSRPFYISTIGLVCKQPSIKAIACGDAPLMGMVDARIPHNLSLNIIKELNNENISQIWVVMANDIQKVSFLNPSSLRC